MDEILYSNIDQLNVSGRRAGHEIRRTTSGISVKRVSLYSDEPTTIRYYKDYPSLPADWSAAINDSGTTEYDLFMRDIDAYKSYKTATV
jgi:hypothetical protein